MKLQLQNIANGSVIINSFTFLSNPNLIDNYIYLILSFSNNRGRFNRAYVRRRSSGLCYMCARKKKKKKCRIRLLPPAITTITTITSIHFLSLSLLYRRWRLQILCVTRIPCFWKWWWKNAHNGRETAWVSAPSFVRSFARVFGDNAGADRKWKELHIYTHSPTERIKLVVV